MSKALGFAAGFLLIAALPAWAVDEASLKRGEVLFSAADCAGCHTDVKGGGQPLAGGRPLATPFGTFYGPNITPDKEHGIGGWRPAHVPDTPRQGAQQDGGYMCPAF